MSELSERIARARELAEGLEALGELVDLLGEQARSRWDLAGELERRLARFESTSGRRIRAGHRAPRDHLETLLARIVATELPRSRRRLYALIVD